MTCSLLTPAHAEIDLALRMLVANGLPHRLLADALGMAVAKIDAMAAGAVIPLWPAERGKLQLFLATMFRLEIRLGHEPRAVRQAFVTPLDLLDGRTPEQAMADGLDGLRAAHRAAGEMVLPATRWWRVAPRQ